MVTLSCVVTCGVRDGFAELIFLRHAMMLPVIIGTQSDITPSKH